MDYALLRQASSKDIPHLKELWAKVFGDPSGEINTFFRFYFQTGRVILAEDAGQIVSAVYSLPTGGIHTPNGQVLPAAMAYALATAPRARGKGLGAAVIDQAARNAFQSGAKYFVLCPAEESLFSYYTGRLGYQDGFYLRETEVWTADLPETKGQVHPASPEEYNAFRDRFLYSSLYLKLDARGSRYQKQLCTASGGNLFFLEGSDFQGCACCEQGDGKLLVKELLAPAERMPEAASLLQCITMSSRFCLRTPAELGCALGGRVRRCGQYLSVDGRTLPLGQTGYYGLAFD